jgi:anti-sigma-K factor RskA
VRGAESAKHGELANLAWIEALGALDTADRARLAAHLREGCAECLGALRGGSDVVAQLAHLFAPAQPSAALRARLARASERRAPAPAHSARPPRRVRIGSAASWVAVAVAAVFGGWAWRENAALRGQLARERSVADASRAALARETQRADELAREHRELNELLLAVAARDARELALRGDGAAAARAFLSGEHLVLFVHALPSAPPGMTYQAWTIENGAPRSAGLFDTDASGHARHRADLSRAAAAGALIAVTLEPAGGVPQPTGRVVLAQR